jgi:hypothetical protein
VDFTISNHLTMSDHQPTTAEAPAPATMEPQADNLSSHRGNGGLGSSSQRYPPSLKLAVIEEVNKGSLCHDIVKKYGLKNRQVVYGFLQWNKSRGNRELLVDGLQTLPNCNQSESALTNSDQHTQPLMEKDMNPDLHTDEAGDQFRFLGEGGEGLKQLISQASALKALLEYCDRKLQKRKQTMSKGKPRVASVIKKKRKQPRSKKEMQPNSGGYSKTS